MALFICIFLFISWRLFQKFQKCCRSCSILMESSCAESFVCLSPVIFFRFSSCDSILQTSISRLPGIRDRSARARLEIVAERFFRGTSRGDLGLSYVLCFCPKVVFRSTQGGRGKPYYCACHIPQAIPV